MNTLILSSQDIHIASTLLQQGELVGIPTETVYGLGANALNPDAVAKIFTAKGRPQDNPLILHIADPSWLTRYCEEIPPTAWQLAEAFWPGPLTMILPSKAIVPDIVRSGLDTVGVRCPNHPLALELIRSCDFPIAAPSGNVSGKPSPTSVSAMAEDMDTKISAILDGGDSLVGVESTIVSVGDNVVLLRSGGIGVEEIQDILHKTVEIPSSHQSQKPVAPGMKYHHYAPQAPVTVVRGQNAPQWIAKEITQEDGVICFEEYASLFTFSYVKIIGKESDFQEQAQQVFQALRYFDSTPVKRIFAQCPMEEGLGRAVANRLQKAAGFRIVDIEE